VTNTSIDVADGPIAFGATLRITPVVSPSPTSGIVTLEIDRFDPLSGWHFHRLLRLRVGESTSWRPVAEGRWRLRATFHGAPHSSPSRSPYEHVLVVSR
jgi:hypothetical protein